MVDDQITYFEKLKFATEKTNETSSSKFKKSLSKFTEVKRPGNKSNNHTPINKDVEKSATLPRNSLHSKNESIAKIAKHASFNKEKADYVEFINNHAVTKKSSRLTRSSLKKKERTTVKIQTSNESDSSILEVGDLENDESDSLENLSDSSVDNFGLNDFDGDSSDNYIIEAYNKAGEELVILTLEITRKTVVRSSSNEWCDSSLADLVYVICESSQEELNSEHALDEKIIIYENLTKKLDNPEQLEDNENKSLEYQHLFEEINEHTDNFHHTICEDFENDECDGEAKALPPQDQQTEINTKVNYVIEEMLKTEELYITSLQIAVEFYKPYLFKKTPPHLTGKTCYLFGNIDKIYERAQEFLEELRQNCSSADAVGKTFINLSHIFYLYPQYSKNKPTADMYLKEFDEIVKMQQNRLHDKLGLASHLLTPIQRLGKYILMLEKIQKELKKGDCPSEHISKALTLIRKVMRKGNDFIAIDSIKECAIDLTLYGSFVMRAYFNILRPRKYISMIFLFENIVVFTERDPKNIEHFKYIDSITMSDLSLAKFEEKPCVFHLRNYQLYKKKHNGSATYVLEAENSRQKNEWTSVIEKKLWRQLEKAKELQKKKSCHDRYFKEDTITLRKVDSDVVKDPSNNKHKLERSKSKFYEDYCSSQCYPK